MTTLLAVEWRRVLARRLVRVSVAVAVLAILAGATVTFLVSREMDPARLSRAQAARQAAIERCLAGQLDEVPSDLPPQQRAEFCEQHISPPIQDRPATVQVLQPHQQAGPVAIGQHLGHRPGGHTATPGQDGDPVTGLADL